MHALLGEFGEPILSSTLIPADATEPLNDPNQIRERYENTLDAILDAGPATALPTTVIDLAGTTPVIVRRGRGDPARLGIELP